MTPSPSRFALNGVGIWTGALDHVPSARARELAAELEQLGYSAIWLPEVANRDPFVHLSFLLGATRRLVGATGIASIWARDAIAMVEATKALTEAFPERVLAGLGVSHRHIVEDLRGHRYDKPLAAMRAYLDRMEASPYTAFRPTTPVRLALAALGPKMLQLAGERTCGAHSYFVTPEHTRSARETLGAAPLLCVEQAVLLEREPAAARDVARQHMAPYLKAPNYLNNLRRLGFDEDDFNHGGSDRLVDAIVAWGDEKAIVTRVQAHFAAGASHVCIQALARAQRGVPEEQWRALAHALTGLRAAHAA